MTGRPWHYALIATCALVVSVPLFFNGPSCGHDFDFHLQSWFAASAAWHAGTLYPHWLPAANYGAGEPRFVFYPPLSWALGGLLGTLLPWTWVPQVFTLLALVACGLAFYTLARAWVSSGTAAAAACVYLANPYLLFVAYERAAYGELLGAITMPLVLLYALRPRPAVVRLALVVAALWLTNAPAAVMGCYLLALCAVWTALTARSLLPALNACAALLLGTGAASVYVLPAWYEQRWVEIARVTGPGMRVEDSFLFAHSGEPFHDQVLHTASWIAVAILGAGLLSTVVCWIVLRARRRVDLNEEGSLGPSLSLPPDVSPAMLPAVLATTLLAIVLLLLPVSEPVWRFAPDLHFLQFPWRWLLVASLAAVLAGATAVESLRPRWSAASGALPRLSMLLILVAVLCAGAWSAGRYAQHNFAQPCDEEDNVRAQQMLLIPPVDPVYDAAAVKTQPAAAPVGFEGTDEYTPADADNGEIQQELPAVRLMSAPEDDEGDDSKNPNPDWQPAASASGRVSIDTWAPEYKRLTVHAPGDRFAVLRLMDYPAWQVRLNGRRLDARPHREDGLLTVPVTDGTTQIEILYHATPDVYAGRALSLVSLAALAGWAGWASRRTRTQGASITNRLSS